MKPSDVFQSVEEFYYESILHKVLTQFYLTRGEHKPRWTQWSSLSPEKRAEWETTYALELETITVTPEEEAAPDTIPPEAVYCARCGSAADPFEEHTKHGDRYCSEHCAEEGPYPHV
jgi:hypothetical protein